VPRMPGWAGLPPEDGASLASVSLDARPRAFSASHVAGLPQGGTEMRWKRPRRVALGVVGLVAVCAALAASPAFGSNPVTGDWYAPYGNTTLVEITESGGMFTITATEPL
jgi:hypothetical protein